MGKVLGVGGLFLQFKGEKQEIHDWYERNLGLEMSKYGSGFTEGEQLMVLTFKNDSEEMPIINFRVDYLDDVIKKISDQGADVGDTLEYNYGRFVQFTDPFGNKVELWEPREEEYREMVRKEIKDYEKDR